MSYSIAVVNLNTLFSNLKLVKNNLNKGVKVCAVVKSNAYGHGLVEVSRAVENLTDCYAVSFLEEGICLRISGITKPILVLLPVKNSDLTIVSRYNLSVAMSDTRQIEYAIKNRIKLKIHIAVNTGMNRLGIDRLSQLNKILNLTKNSLTQVEGIFSHFYSTEKSDCDKQYKRFLPFVIVAKKFNKKIISHISASGGCAYPQYNLDMVRVGILMYGYFPSDKKFLPVKPCLKIYARKLCDRKLKKGKNLLYGNYNLQTCANISIIKYGYADGGDRTKDIDFNNRCMDLSAVKKCKKYHIVLDNAETIAKKLGTISYDVLVKYTARCRSRYENNCRQT